MAISLSWQWLSQQMKTARDAARDFFRGGPPPRIPDGWSLHAFSYPQVVTPNPPMKYWDLRPLCLFVPTEHRKPGIQTGINLHHMDAATLQTALKMIRIGSDPNSQPAGRGPILRGITAIAQKTKPQSSLRAYRLDGIRISHTLTLEEMQDLQNYVSTQHKAIMQANPRRASK